MQEFVFLRNNKVFSWEKRNGFCVKNNSLNKQKIDFPKSASLIDLLEYYQSKSNSFVWVYQNDNQIVCCSDQIRSFPLFYYWDGTRFAVSDEVEFLKNKFSPKVNTAQLEPFQILGHTLGNETLWENIFVLLPHQHLTYNVKTNNLSVVDYLKKQTLISENKTQDFIKMSDAVFGDLIERLDGRTAIIPLSGGLDSRFILAALLKKGYQNIICYTYGKQDSFEVETAKRICTELKVKWFFVPYDANTFKSYLSKKAWDYETYSAQYTTIAHEQDYFAIEYLKQQNLLPENSMIIPGFCADLPAGSTVPVVSKFNKIEYSIEGLVDFLLKKYFYYTLKTAPTYLVKQIKESITNQDIHDFEDWMYAYDCWFIYHKVSKFVTNAIRCFEFFDLSWELPFWDQRFINYWTSIPLEDKVNRALYKEMLIANYFKPLNIDFHISTADEELSNKKLVLAAKKIIPQNFKNGLKKLLLKKSEQDVNSLTHFGNLLAQDVASNQNFKNENQAHAHWYLVKQDLIPI